VSWSTALITGGSTGIGASIARALVARGARVVVVARRQEPLDALAAELGDKLLTLKADVADPARAAQVVEEAHQRLGSLDLVIANAGIGYNKPAKDLRVEHILDVLQLNVIGACATITAAIPIMVAQGRGTLVGVSSLAAMRGLPTSAAYSASKAALSVFLESLRVELTPLGVVVSDVRPGFVDTPLTQKNKFKMPFLMSSEAAAALILRKLEAKKAVIAFPWPTATAMRVLAALPRPLYEWIARAAAPK
jgi:short-subunit dehydrogenase